MSRAVVLSVGALLVLLAGGIAYLLPSQETHAPAQPSPSGINQWQAFITEHFAFDEACKDCHVEQFAAHQRSGHSRTATPMRETNVADKLDGTEYRDQRRDQSFTFKRSSDSFLVQATEENPFPVHWLLGSGVHARTPVSIDPVSGHPKPLTSHTLNPVRCSLFDPAGLAAKSNTLSPLPPGLSRPSQEAGTPETSLSLSVPTGGAGLANVSATCLNLLGFEAPEQMEPSLLTIKTEDTN